MVPQNVSLRVCFIAVRRLELGRWLFLLFYEKLDGYQENRTTELPGRYISEL